MVLTESWQFRRSSVEAKNQDTHILERYIHIISCKQSIDYNSAKDALDAARYFYVENECACFHTGLYMEWCKSVYAFFDRNKRRDSMLDWYFRGLCDEVYPRLKYIEPLAERPRDRATGILGLDTIFSAYLPKNMKKPDLAMTLSVMNGTIWGIPV